ncbi:MAG: hypothetical protein J2P40_06955, partial [Candidatus Dormibacteraeota bacterium]|nr:hypothetical protein [Candidatus Dormibacteraeota bacterium]MBO0760996.1 hypothetical protein [Candidatus Dormibacteraeota bacterium]
MLLARAGHALAEPFRGVTTGGGVVPGLFSPGRTGASPAPLVAAAGAFLGALLGVARVWSGIGRGARRDARFGA